MIDHISFSVSDLARAAAFYDAVLEPLGYVRVWRFEDAVGYGVAGGGDKLALKKWDGKASLPSPRFHLAFTARDRAGVDGFFAAATASGGQDDGGPGLRPKYGPGYYAAFVIDPDGHRIEAVCHEEA